MTNEEEVIKLRAAIRKHRDMSGDDRCYIDDAELYSVLPEGDTRPETCTAVTIENCAKFIECRQSGREYISPQRRIEELEVEVQRLKNQNGIKEISVEERAACEALGQCWKCDNSGMWRCSYQLGHIGDCNFTLVR